ncbi:asparagine synthetase B [Aurantibacillus circumpalustris]|uniref:asparagine synthetase B n=1 Tax=Aurantibacillus circumpalustris TaxID=3036359 RepID=UPI00295C1D3B|nr:asparagine synthetase B [Aurantibacillus circumpalustris]
MKKILFLFFFFFFAIKSFGSYLLIPMDDAQKNHLKAYGLAYWALKGELEIHWLLNYRGGSFMIPNVKAVANECVIRGISYETVSDAQGNSILADIANPEVNQDAVKLEKAPRIAVYSPKGKQPWDDAVTLVLKYAEIPYDVLYDEEIFLEKLKDYDWLHLHHEDFTGQYGKFYSGFRNAAWYQAEVKENEAMAKKLGFTKVSLMKLHTAKRIKDFVFNGGFLFAMCSATDSYDIALAAEGIDICESVFDHDPADKNATAMLDFSKGFAFEDYKLSMNPMEYEYSTIDTYGTRNQYGPTEKTDIFTLFEFSAKWDPVPTMLCQNHTSTIKGFWGQTAAFDKKYIKKNVLIMGETKAYGEARYIHGDFGKGTWTFYSGHDPEDYQHRVEEPPTDLSLHPNSPGYRLILNNILFPAAKKKKQKT